MEQEENRPAGVVACSLLGVIAVVSIDSAHFPVFTNERTQSWPFTTIFPDGKNLHHYYYCCCVYLSLHRRRRRIGPRNTACGTSEYHIHVFVQGLLFVSSWLLRLGGNLLPTLLCPYYNAVVVVVVVSRKYTDHLQIIQQVVIGVRGANSLLS